VKITNQTVNLRQRLVAVALLVLSATIVHAQMSSALDEAQAAFKANDLNKASQLLEPLTGEGAQNARAFHLLSGVRIAQKNTKDAVVLAEKATLLDGTKAEYFSQLGMALGMRMGEVGFMQQAMMAGRLKQAFAKAVELDPNDLAGLIGLARFYVQAPAIAGGSLDKAKELAHRVEQLDPFLGAVELGGIAEREENFVEALKHFETASTLRPNNAGLQYQCGRMLAKLRRTPEARSRFEAALKINPAFEAASKSLTELDAPAG
jgi:Flp pilus assembly protein TadD